MTDSPFLRRALWGAITTLLVASVLAGAVIGGDAGDGDGTPLAVGSSTTTTTIDNGGTGGGDGGDAGATGDAAVVSSTTLAGTLSAGPSSIPPAKAAGGGTVTTASGASTTSTAAGAPPAQDAGGFADLGPAADGGTVKVPAAGTYPYTTKTPDGPGQGSITIEDKGDAGDGARNLVMSLRGLGAGGFDSVNDVTWGTADVKILKSSFSFGAQSATCDWEPDYVELKLPLSKGASWQASSSCTVGAAIVKRSTTNTVADARRVRVAGEAIDVWLITGTERIEFNGQVEEAKVSTWFSGKHGLIVKSVAESSRGTGEYEIQSLTPQ